MAQAGEEGLPESSETVEQIFETRRMIEDDDTEEESEDESEEDEEPKLKYERMGNDLANILSKDAASCMCVHPKFLALGTHWGTIHILDHMGHNIRNQELPAHTTTVNQISIDDNGDYVASCSDDGRVVINGLYSTDNNQVVNFDRPIKAVAMDPFFFKSGSGKHFVTGDDKLVLNEKGLWRNKTYVLHQGEGPIRSIKWKSTFIAWSNDQGVKVYDISSKKRITFIARENQSFRPELYRCNLCWKDDTTLLIGWGNTVKVCIVKDRPARDVRDLPNRYVEIVAMFTTDFMVCGIGPHFNNVVVLTYDESEVVQESGKVIGPRPNLRILQPSMDDHEEVSNDALSIRGFQEYRCNDYHLESLPEDNIFFIVSPKDVVIARERDTDDHIQWLLEHQMFEEAMAAAAEHAKDIKRHNYQDIGRLYLAHLMEAMEYDKAARLCVKVLGKNKEMWEEQVYVFASIHQLRAISTYLPRGEPRLSPVVYEMVMNEFLETDHVGFQNLIQDWPSDLYNIQTVVNAVLDKLDKEYRNSPALLKCLGELYSRDKRYDKALYIYLKLKHKDVFDLIHRHNLFDSITDKIVLLMEFDSENATKMLIDNVDKVPVSKVVHQLEHKRNLLHEYLDRLFHKDAHLGQDFHEIQVRLYAEFDRSKLLSFLRSSNYYPLQKALEECQQRNFIPEMVFLLGRMGKRKEALELITHDLKDVGQAIDFCKEHNDEELWEDLINYSIDKPSFITGLLQNIGTHVDPIILIRKIREGMEIPGLRDSLVKILHDYNLQISLREGCRKILVADGFSLLNRLVKTQRKGMRIDESQVCHSCHEHIIVRDVRFSGSVMIFYCRHTFHRDCLPAHNMESCPICSAQVRSPGVSMTGAAS